MWHYVSFHVFFPSPLDGICESGRRNFGIRIDPTNNLPHDIWKGLGGMLCIVTHDSLPTWKGPSFAKLAQLGEKCGVLITSQTSKEVWATVAKGLVVEDERSGQGRKLWKSHLFLLPSDERRSVKPRK